MSPIVHPVPVNGNFLINKGGQSTSANFSMAIVASTQHSVLRQKEEILEEDTF